MSKRKLQRLEQQIKANSNSRTKISDKQKTSLERQYTMNKAKVASGTSRSNQQAINAINTEMEDIWANIQGLHKNDAYLDQKMAVFDKEDVQPIAKKVSILTDIMLLLCNELGVDPDLTEDELETLGLNYKNEQDGEDVMAEEYMEADEDVVEDAMG